MRFKIEKGLSPHLAMVITTINLSEIVVIWPNLAVKRGPHFVDPILRRSLAFEEVVLARSVSWTVHKPRFFILWGFGGLAASLGSDDF